VTISSPGCLMGKHIHNRFAQNRNRFSMCCFFHVSQLNASRLVIGLAISACTAIRVTSQAHC
jgi:hypothetical protein